jgi:DNA-directed RNA polymerase specialized sigma24 family protein
MGSARQPEAVTDGLDFDAFIGRVDRPLRQALVGALGSQRGAEAHAAALSYAWIHRDRVTALDSPVGYLYRVGRSSVRSRRRRLPPAYPPADPGNPEFEPRLPAALAALSSRQRLSVFLVVGCGWPAAEAARLQEISESTVRAHVVRGLARLRRELGVDEPQRAREEDHDG